MGAKWIVASPPRFSIPLFFFYWVLYLLGGVMCGCGMYLVAGFRYYDRGVSWI